MVCSLGKALVQRLASNASTLGLKLLALSTQRVPCGLEGASGCPLRLQGSAGRDGCVNEAWRRVQKEDILDGQEPKREKEHKKNGALYWQSLKA